MTGHLRQHLLLGDATDSGIGFEHTDVIDVVQLAFQPAYTKPQSDGRFLPLALRC